MPYSNGVVMSGRICGKSVSVVKMQQYYHFLDNPSVIMVVDDGLMANHPRVFHYSDFIRQLKNDLFHSDETITQVMVEVNFDAVNTKSDLTELIRSKLGEETIIQILS